MFDFDKIWQMIKRLRVSSAPPHTHTHPLPIPPFHSLLHDIAQGTGFFTLEVHSSTTHEVMLQTRSCALSNPSRRSRQGLSLDGKERLKVFLKKKKKKKKLSVNRGIPQVRQQTLNFMLKDLLFVCSPWGRACLLRPVWPSRSWAEEIWSRWRARRGDTNHFLSCLFTH